MVSTTIQIFRANAREGKLLQGAEALTDVIRFTLGPKSKFVLIQKGFDDPIVCNDGVTIAKEASLLTLSIIEGASTL